MSGSLWSVVDAHERRRQDDSHQLSIILVERLTLNWYYFLRLLQVTSRGYASATLAKRLHGLCKSSGVVSCVASLLRHPYTERHIILEVVTVA